MALFLLPASVAKKTSILARTSVNIRESEGANSHRTSDSGGISSQTVLDGRSTLQSVSPAGCSISIPPMPSVASCVGSVWPVKELEAESESASIDADVNNGAAAIAGSERKPGVRAHQSSPDIASSLASACAMVAALLVLCSADGGAEGFASASAVVAASLVRGTAMRERIRLACVIVDDELDRFLFFFFLFGSLVWVCGTMWNPHGRNAYMWAVSNLDCGS